MTDYTKPTGSTGTMMIKDTGTYVEFWLKAGSATFNHATPWGYTVNGVTDNTNSFDFQSGGAWQRLGSWNVTTDQTVTFRLFDTGTAGLGGPTTLTATIDRTNAPPAPGAWAIEQIQDVQVQGDTDSMPNGGLTIDQVQVGYGTNASTPTLFKDPGLDGYDWITGLARGTTYYFWVRTHNSKGWSPWSARTSALTKNFPPAPTSPTFSNIKQTSVNVIYAGNGDGGSPVLEWQIGYSLSSTTPDTYKSGGSNTVVTGLSAGAVYYFWTRARNQWGWGAWSARSTVTLFAGAWVDYGGVKKRAVPYVNVAGVWKVAEPWAKIAGLWKVTG